MIEPKNVHVLGDRCMVRLLSARTETDSGIQLITEEEYREQEAEVISVGTPGPVKAGDRILFEKFAGCPIDLGDTDLYMIVDYADILAILGGKDDAL